MLQGHVGSLDELLTHYLAHGTAQEIEFKGAGNQRNTHGRAFEGHQCVFLARGFLGCRQAILVTLGVFELQAIGRLEIRSDFLTAVFVQEDIQPTTGVYPHVVVTLRANVEILLELRLVQEGATLGAFFPQTFRHAGTLP